MSDELIYTNLKQEWFDAIIPHLTANGFQEVVENKFERVQIARLPGQTISINGRVMQQPGKEIKIVQSVWFVGDGWVADEDEETKKQEFTQVLFEAYQGEEQILFHEEAIYWDDPEYFLMLFNKAFN